MRVGRQARAYGYDRGIMPNTRRARPAYVDLAGEDLEARLQQRNAGLREISQRIEKTFGAPRFFGHGMALFAADQQPERDADERGDADGLPGMLADEVVGSAHRGARLLGGRFAERSELVLGRFEAVLDL